MMNRLLVRVRNEEQELILELLGRIDERIAALKEKILNVEGEELISPTAISASRWMSEEPFAPMQIGSIPTRGIRSRLPGPRTPLGVGAPLGCFESQRS